ncbi:MULTISPECIES: MBL fold metallo-hydrolase [Sphingomonas]|jgi:L-ascorbate metabolism protein UlaG (beta-lactamase superfamily)|uniref:Zn-dependent hydrolase n=1 Tax=Sphingomonas zeae TaxID=1646122 RepID=A0A7Y6EGL2_9SPHN|nr:MULTISPECIES: MBL fold metallo-hydrolase [Sphingomonas]MBB4048138.1 L-ascorbate metabolism protein UlaG (beta-lactamase superfamily) [Sphingomonas zeae]MDK8184783.1 MBL fold metallo-hydrolase [Sphingomonas zeae]MDK8215504.1 MBL fold metallo-hydrolase [Sphingomonas sp. UMB7805-LC452B]NUU46958.1 Zn-dependent hydrolase [Sphingomonas zeae]
MKRVGRIAKGLALILILLGLTATIVPHYLDRLYYVGPETGHYDGERFFNPDGDADTLRMPTRGGRGGFLWRQLTGDDGRPDWPHAVPVHPSKPEARVTGQRMVATWIGHATVLIQTQGLNILTDPVYAERAGPFGFGPKRVAIPGIAFDDLPRIDVVLVSHNHYDHLDQTTLQRLWRRDRPLIITSLGNDSVIDQVGVPATALDWGREKAIRPGVSVAVTRNHHWGSRWFADRNRALWSSFVVRLPGGNVFFAGDTGMGDGRWPGEAAKLGPVRLALLPIGAFRFVPGQMASGSHIGPPQAVQIFERLGASTAIPIHWGTFRLSYEGYDTPPKLLDAAMRCSRAPGRFMAVRLGEPVEVGPFRAGGAPRTGDAAMRACLDTARVRALR